MGSRAAEAAVGAAPACAAAAAAEASARALPASLARCGSHEKRLSLFFFFFFEGGKTGPCASSRAAIRPS